MIRSRKFLLLGALLALLVQAAPTHARADRSCHPIGLARAGQFLVLRNTATLPVTLTLSFQRGENADAQPWLACGSHSLEAGQSSPARSLAQWCPGVVEGQAGVLRACTRSAARPTPRGAASGELLADVMGNNIELGAR